MKISAGHNNSYKNNPSFGIKYTPQDFRRATKNYIEIVRSGYDNPLNFVFSKEFSIGNAIKATKNYDKFVEEQADNGRDIHFWNNADFKLIEGMQYGLKSFENMTMKGIFSLIELLSNRKNLTLPVVRGCFHNCAHCFLGAKAPVERMSFEDFTNLFADVNIMSSRIHKKINENIKGSELFYDSDGTQVYLSDKLGKEHEFPELTHIMYKHLRAKSLFDTAGWDPKSEKIQKRMERLVEYYVQNPKAFDKEITAINLSVNPFESMYFTAIKQKKAGNIESYKKLKNLYINMVTNMIHTFSPLFENDNVSIICRVFPDHFKGKELDGFRWSDMYDLRSEIIETYKEKYPDQVKRNPLFLELLKEKFNINEDVGKTARDNFLKNFSNDRFERRYTMDLTSSEFEQVKHGNQNVLINMDGNVYLGDDYRLFKTDLKLDFENPHDKKLELPVYPKIIEFQK